MNNNEYMQRASMHACMHAMHAKHVQKQTRRLDQSSSIRIMYREGWRACVEIDPVSKWKNACVNAAMRARPVARRRQRAR